MNKNIKTNIFFLLSELIKVIVQLDIDTEKLAQLHNILQELEKQVNEI